MCAVSPFLSKFYGFPFGVDPRCCEIAYPLAFIYLSHCYSIARDDRWRLSVCLCVSVCLSSLLRSHFLWNLMKLCTVIWGRKTKTEFVGVKIRWCLPYFVPDFPQISIILMHFQWDGLCTAVSTPVDRLWWSILNTSQDSPRRPLGCLTVKWHNPQCSRQNSPKL